MILDTSLVSVQWLKNHFEDENLIILDATIPKVTSKDDTIVEKKQIKGSVFFDIKNAFSDTDAPFPNTVLSAEKFEDEVQKLGVNQHSVIVVYDDLGIYSSPRVWWMFRLMGFKNIAVLDGGLPAWKQQNLPTETPVKRPLKKGDFKALFHPKLLKVTSDILKIIDDKHTLILYARSLGRFLGTTEEPRKGVKSGHIPSSKNLPFGELLHDGKMKSSQEIKEIFHQFDIDNKQLIFSCGTGITASIIALGAELAGINEYSVYDGSWTEWGSTEGLPIEI